MTGQPVLPAWAEELRTRYLSGEASMFLLHGNVRDIQPWEEDGKLTHLTLREFLERFLARSKDIVLYYNVSEGLEFPSPTAANRFRGAIDARRTLRGEASLGPLPRDPEDVLPLVEEIVTDPTLRAGVIIDYIETVVPMGELSFMGTADKANLVALQRWSSDPALLRSDNLVIMVSENLTDVHRRVVSSAQLVPVKVSMPSVEERLAYIQTLDHQGVELEVDDEALSKVTAGLTLVQLGGLFRAARQSGDPITFRTVSRRKKAIIEQECHGLVEFVDPRHDFSHVGGMERIKHDLMRVSRAIRRGQTNRVPMGVLFVGPMGTGKTFMAEAFAAESGLTCIQLKNFREKWVGSTEGNLEKILQVVDGLGYVLLIIDEADRSMSGGGEGDGGTSSRVIARLKEFMSDTSHRGRVVMVMMTNRPDKLDSDLKRPGRIDLKIPFFFPQSDEERVSIIQALVRKNKLHLEEDTPLGPISTALDGYSGAEMEAVLLAAANLAADNEVDQISPDHLAAAVAEVIPSRDTRMLELMEMLAVFESSSRSMLPDHYQKLDTQQVHARLDELRAALGGRV